MRPQKGSRENWWEQPDGMQQFIERDLFDPAPPEETRKAAVYLLKQGQSAEDRRYLERIIHPETIQEMVNRQIQEIKQNRKEVP